MNAIVVSFERLPLGFLGCYGNHWIETPNFDRLAARAAVFDQNFGTYFGESDQLPAWWTGWHELRFPAAPASQTQTAPELLHDAGVATRLLREGDHESETVAPRGFDHISEIGGSDEFEGDYAETPFARLISAAIDQVQEFSQSTQPWLLWLQSRGVPIPWLPPEPFATLYLDEVTDVIGGELSQSDAALDEAALFERLDENLLSGGRLNGGEGLARQFTTLEWRLSRAVYAGYVSLLDHRLGKLLDTLDAIPGAAHTLLIVVAAAGESLGESDLAPEGPGGLREELVHTPFLVAPWKRRFGTRHQILTQTTDVAPTLLDWFNVPLDNWNRDGQSVLPWIIGDSGKTRDCVYLGDASGRRAIQTEDFALIEEPAEHVGMSSAKKHSLFIKPEDLWNVNNVAHQLRDDTDRLISRLHQLCAKMPQNGA